MIKAIKLSARRVPITAPAIVPALSIAKIQKNKKQKPTLCQVAEINFAV